MGEERETVSKSQSNSAVTIEDFHRSGWKEALDAAGRDGYPRLWSGLVDAANQRFQDGDVASSKVLRLLADACSMMLKPNDSGAPFKPMLVMKDGRHSTMPEDLGDEALNLFTVAVQKIDHVWVKARLADLLWIRKGDYKMARMAIEAYREIPLDDARSLDRIECWQRAISLARELRDGNQQSEMVEAVLQVLRDTAAKEEALCRSLSKLLFGEKLSGENVLEVAQILKRRAAALMKSGRLGHASRYYETCVKWFEWTGNKSLETEAVVAHAEAYETHALTHQSSDPPNNIAASRHLEKAIQIYRSVPKAQRGAYEIDERIERLRESLSEAHKNSLDQMSTVTTGPIDISEVVEQARECVRGKSAPQALASLSLISRGAQLAALQEGVEETRSEYPLQSLVPKSDMSSDGRVIAKRAGEIPAGDEDSGEHAASLHDDVIKHFAIDIAVKVQACILPALEVVRGEHSFQEADFISLAERSPLVPTGREQLVGKALYWGFRGDFGTALHLLVPQVEYIVREQIKGRGGSTTHIDSNDIETENSLNTLVKFPELKEIFGEDFAFEINALFCEPLGPNLRNEVAHGLVDDRVSQSPQSIYAWWFMLRLVLAPDVENRR